MKTILIVVAVLLLLGCASTVSTNMQHETLRDVAIGGPLPDTQDPPAKFWSTLAKRVLDTANTVYLIVP
jgi:hypothetical protein